MLHTTEETLLRSLLSACHMQGESSPTIQGRKANLTVCRLIHAKHTAALDKRNKLTVFLGNLHYNDTCLYIRIQTLHTFKGYGYCFG